MSSRPKIDSVIMAIIKGADKFNGNNYHSFRILLEKAIASLELTHFIEGLDEKCQEPLDKNNPEGTKWKDGIGTAHDAC
jgi:hypothetical protein